MNILKLIGRDQPLFAEDVQRHADELVEIVGGATFLIVGGAGSIGQAVTREIFKRNPKVLHVVDINENNLVELVRDIRSTLGYIDGDFRTFAIDAGGREFEALCESQPRYDFIFNLSALKHVRSEKDPFTLMRMIEVNIENTIKILHLAGGDRIRKYFCVSTDKAANPVNMMGASKRIMEMFLMRESAAHPVSTARFANVAFSDGSLLHGFNQRVAKRQPIAAPSDVRRYFVTPQESGELCMMSGLLGSNRDIFFPKLDENLHSLTFAEIARNYLESLGYEAHECESEQDARDMAQQLIARRLWPCVFSHSDTTGEKDLEEFYIAGEALDMDRFSGIGIVKSASSFDAARLDEFRLAISDIRAGSSWKKQQILEAFVRLLPDFAHKEAWKHLDDKM